MKHRPSVIPLKLWGIIEKRCDEEEYDLFYAWDQECRKRIEDLEDSFLRKA